MKIEYITIDAGQRFDAVMPEIPTNSIINKTVTGCGATYAEINATRHSVIIEPNVPVIEGKMKKHPQILGVTSTWPTVAENTTTRKEPSFVWLPDR